MFIYQLIGFKSRTFFVLEDFLSFFDILSPLTGLFLIINIIYNLLIFLLIYFLLMDFFSLGQIIVNLQISPKEFFRIILKNYKKK
jgi:hypothetical protein